MSLPVLTKKDGKLKAPFKRRWVAALRSGEYVQGDQALAAPTWPDPKSRAAVQGYCCLGVAGELCGVLDMMRSGTSPQGPGWGTVGGCDAFLPLEMGLSEQIMEKLAEFNDGGESGKPKSFAWIASYIERYL